MKKNAGIACLAAALLTAGFASAKQPEPANGNIDELLTMRVEGTLAVDENGNVLAHTVDTEIDPRFKALIDKAVAQWKFMPVTVEGKPARAKSDMRVTLAARELADGGMSVKIDNVIFYDRAKDRTAANEEAVATAASKKAPFLRIARMTRKIEYPRGYHLNGVVTMAIQGNPDDGTVANVTPTQCSLYFAKASPEELARACKLLGDSVARAIRTWKIGVDLNGAVPTADNMTAMMSVEFRMQGDERRIEGSAKAGQWRAEARTPYAPATWLKPDGFTQRVGTSDVEGSEMLPGRSKLQFRDGTEPKA